MNFVYYVRDINTYCILNKKNGWTRSINSYGLKEFESEEAAKAAFVPGVECIVVKSTKKVVNLEKESKYNYVLDYRGKYLSLSDEFILAKEKDNNVKKFSSENEAVAKAEELDINLEKIIVIRVKK